MSPTGFGQSQSQSPTDPDAPAAAVVIPAYDEASVIDRCLDVLEGRDVFVVVVPNGCHDDTAEIARRRGVEVVELAEGNKRAALNAGDAAVVAAGHGDLPRIYLDADITMSGATFDALVAALTTDRAVAAAPRVHFDTSAASPGVKAFYDVYTELPYVRSEMIGLGVYGMSAAGRARFDEFPDLLSDDLFAQRLFAPDERIVVDGTFTVSVPRDLRSLLKVRTRVARGNRQLAQAHQDDDRFATTGGSTIGALGDLVRSQPTKAPAAGLYLGHTALSRVLARRDSGPAWGRDDSTRATASSSHTAASASATEPENAPRVAYLVSQYPCLSHTFIEREVLGLRSVGVDVRTHSVRPCPPSELRSVAMREEAATTLTLHGTSKAEIAAAHAALARRSPAGYAAGLAMARRSGQSSLKPKVWQGFYFAEGVVLYERLRAQGIRHLHAHFANVSCDIARIVVAIGRAEDGPDAGWRWSFTMHGPTEFEEVSTHDLPAKVEDADGVSAISDFCRSQLMRMVDPAHWSKIDVVHMTVDAQTYLPPAGGRPGDGPINLLYVGRLVPEKGAPILLEAVSLLRDRGVDVHVRIVGGGQLADSLAADIARRGLESVVDLVGPVGQDDMPGEYHRADVFVLPSFQEGLPVVLMEALATELPVVTTRIAGVAELVVDGEIGRLVPAGRADLLADAVASLADPALRVELGRAGRRAVEASFTPVTEAPAMAAFLAGVTPQHP